MLVQVSLRIDGEIYRRILALVERANRRPMTMGATAAAFMRSAIVAGLMEVESRAGTEDREGADEFYPSEAARTCEGGPGI